MDVDKLIEDTTAALQAKERGKYGREVVIERDGVTCTVSEERGRYGGWKLRTQLKKDGKVVSKASLLGDTYKGMNDALRAAFEAQAPQLAADYADFMRGLFKRYEEAFKGRIPAFPHMRSFRQQGASEDPTEVSEAQYKTIKGTLLEFATTEDVDLGTVRFGQRQTLRVIHLDETRLAEKARKYGDEVAVQWFYKTNEKLGAVEQPELHLDSGGNVVVSGKRDGKAIRMEQQRIINVSPLGLPFHQFPARIYVDGKFYPEAAYKKAFLSQ